MKIDRLEISNFRGIEKLDIECHDRLNVFIGENGAGKSAVLNCLAIMLSRLTWRIVSKSSTGRVFTEADVRRGERRINSKIYTTILNKQYFWMAGKSILRSKKSTLSNQEEIKSLVDHINQQLDKDTNFAMPLAVFYSTNRAVVDVPLRIRKQHEFDQIAALENSLSGTGERADFKLFFEWFRNREDIENEHIKSVLDQINHDEIEYLKTSLNALMNKVEMREPPFLPKESKNLHKDLDKLENRLNIEKDKIFNKKPFTDKQLDAVRTAITSLLPDFSNLQVKRKPTLRMVVIKDDKEFRIEELSDGEKCLLALVADMARRLAMANPDMENPLEGEAVFLIDEIELHLHPTWQRMIVPKLLEVFPNSQFFLTTHSPQVLSEIRDPKSVWIMKAGEEPYHPQATFGFDTNEILQKIMATPNLPTDIQDRLNEVDAFISSENFDAARATILKLAEETHPSLPILHEVNGILTMLGEEEAEL